MFAVYIVTLQKYNEEQSRKTRLSYELKQLMRTRDELRKQVESHLHVCLHPEQLRSLTSNITSETSTVRNDESRSISIAVAVTNDSLTSELVGYSNGYDYDHDYDLERILSGECCESLRTITAPQDNPSSDGSIFNEDCRCDSFSGMHLSEKRNQNGLYY